MSSQVFPTSTQLPGMAIEITRTAQWDTIVQQAVSGKETRIARRTLPRRTWDLKFNFLRSSTTWLEFQSLESFFNGRSGMFDSFLFTDPDDNSIANQLLGSGDGATSTFQLVRNFGSFTDVVTAPTTAIAVTIGSSAISTASFTVNYWLSSAPGTIIFSSIPPAGQAISATFSYYWPVRFTVDDMSFDKMVNQIWEAKKVTFISIL